MACFLLLAVMRESAGEVVALDDGIDGMDHLNKPAPKPKPAKSTGCPTMKQAFEKLQGNMKRIESLHMKAEARAHHAELEARRQKEAATRCLRAQTMLSGPARVARTKVQTEIKSQIGKSRKKFVAETSKLNKKWKEKVKLAVNKQKAKQQASFQGELKKVQLNAKTKVTKWATKYKLMKANLKKAKVLHKIKIKKLQAKLKLTQRKVVPITAAVTRAHQEASQDAKTMRKANANNAMAVKLFKARLKAKTKEAESCRKALNGQGKRKEQHLKLFGDKPCPKRVEELLAQVKSVRKNSDDFKLQATRTDSRLVAMEVQLKAAKARIAELEKDLHSQTVRTSVAQEKARWPTPVAAMEPKKDSIEKLIPKKPKRL